MTVSLSDFIDGVSPGIRSAVEFLWNKGWQTVDSGDGSNFAAGMEGAIPYDHVAIRIDPQHIISETQRLVRELEEAGAPNVMVEATFFPRENIVILLISDPESTEQLRQLHTN